MLFDLNTLTDDLLEEALTAGTMTLHNGLVYQLKTEHILRIISFIKRNRPVRNIPTRKSLLPDDFDLDALLREPSHDSKPLDDRLP